MDKDALKSGVNQVSRLAQAILIIRLLPSLLAHPPAKSNDKADDVETADIFKKIHQAAELLEALSKNQIFVDEIKSQNRRMNFDFLFLPIDNNSTQE